MPKEFQKDIDLNPSKLLKRHFEDVSTKSLIFFFF